MEAAGCRSASMVLAVDVDYSSSGFAYQIPTAVRISFLISGAPKNPGVKCLPSGSAHGYLNAPYGVFRTSDGYLALAMTPLGDLATAHGDPEIAARNDPASSGFDRREQIHSRIEDHLRKRPAAVWEAEFCGRGIWCARALTWDDMMDTDTFRSLDLVKAIRNAAGGPSHFFRAPFRLDGERPDVHGIRPAFDADGCRIRTEIVPA